MQEGPQASEVQEAEPAAEPQHAPELTALGASAGGMTVARVLALQASAGNAAVNQLMRNGAATATPPAPGAATPQTTRTGVVGANDAIYMALAIGGVSDQDRESVLREVLLNHDRLSELKADYEARYHRELAAHILEACGEETALRADEYMEWGRLRPVAKILLAVDGAGTSDETLFRVIPEAFRDGDPVGKWQQLVSRPHPMAQRWASTTIDQALEGDLSDGDLDKGRALLRFGRLRPVDKIRVAVNEAGTNEVLLFEGLREATRESIRAEYETEYHESLERRLFDQRDESGRVITEGELSGEDEAYAKELLGTAASDPQRLVRIITVAVTGLGTNLDMIWQAVEDTNRRAGGTGADAAAAQAQRAALRAQVEDPADPLGLTGVTGDLGDADYARLRAMLGIPVAEGESTVGQGHLEAAVLNDPLVMKLRGLGGVNNSTTFETLLKLDKATTEQFAAAYNTDESPLHRYLWRNVTLNSGEWGELAIIFNGSLYRRLRMCAGGMRDDYEDYAYNLVREHATAEERLALRQALRAKDQGNDPPASEAGRAINAVFEAFSTAELGPLRQALQADSIAVLDRAEELEENVERERSWWFGLDPALQDERRELQVGAQSAGLDARMDPAEEARLRGSEERTAAALAAYVQMRDEYTNYASQAVSFAAGLLVTAATGGAAGPVVMAALLRAAVASAIARVVTEKTLRGDRFDLTGGDGVRAFINGAVDGTMNVVGAGVARNVMGAVGGAAVREALERGTAGLALRTTASALEGGTGGLAGGIVDATTNEDTWRGGVSNGLETVINAGISSAGQGAAISGAITLGSAGVEGLGSRLRTGGEAPGTTTAAGHGEGAVDAATPHLELNDSHPLVSMVREGGEAARPAIRDLLRQFDRWETAIGHLQAGTGPAAQLSPGVRAQMVAELVAHRQGILTVLNDRFNARPQEGASTEAGSDADLNVQGADAGAQYLNARAYMDQNYPGWQKQYRMALLVDASRVQTVNGALDGLEPAARVQVEQRVARTGEMFSLARQARRATGAERAEILTRISDADRPRVQQLVDMDPAAIRGAHDQALLDGDALMRRMSGETNPQERARLAAEVTEKQMLANMLNDDAYITPGAVGRFAEGRAVRSPQERYQAAIDQIDMIGHQIHEHGGVLAAMRRYEIFKYIQRYCEMLEGSGQVAGDDLAQLTFFKNWAEYVYRVEREATGSAAPVEGRRLAGSAGTAGVRLSDAAPATRPGVPDSFLLQNYEQFRTFADRLGGSLRDQALGTEGGAAAPMVRLPHLTDADAAARTAGSIESSTPTTTPAGGAATAGTTPLLGHANAQLGTPVASEEAARLIVHRLAAGQSAALSEIGITPPPGYDPRGREWGIGRTRGGEIVIVEGGGSVVDWGPFMAAGGTSIAHSHPLTPGRLLRDPGRTVAELLPGTRTDNIDAIHVLPSVEDFMFVGRHGLETHDVHTPYVNLGEGRIGNPDPANPQPTVSFRLNGTRHVGNVGDLRIWQTMLIGYDSAGTVFAMTPVYVGDAAVLQSINLDPPAGMVPVATPVPGTGGAAGAGDHNDPNQP
jgi:hypothetical protein